MLEFAEDLKDSAKNYTQITYYNKESIPKSTYHKNYKNTRALTIVTYFYLTYFY